MRLIVYWICWINYSLDLGISCSSDLWDSDNGVDKVLERGFRILCCNRWYRSNIHTGLQMHCCLTLVMLSGVRRHHSIYRNDVCKQLSAQWLRKCITNSPANTPLSLHKIGTPLNAAKPALPTHLVGATLLSLRFSSLSLISIQVKWPDQVKPPTWAHALQVMSSIFIITLEIQYNYAHNTQLKLSDSFIVIIVNFWRRIFGISKEDHLI